jgi:DNA-binding MarR family transcriptional regulator
MNYAFAPNHQERPVTSPAERQGPVAPHPADLMVSLMHALRAIQAAGGGDRIWTDLHLTMAQFKALALVASTGGLTSRGLAERLGIGPSAVTPLVDRLIGQKLVRRENDPDDRRVAWIRPTPRALALWEKLLQINRSVVAEMVETMPARDLERVQQALGLLLDAAQRALERHRAQSV